MPISIIGNIDPNDKLPGGYKILRPKEILSEETMAKLYEMGLRPKFVVLFGRNDKDSSLENRVIHTDVSKDETGKWKKLLFGINWEINSSHNDFVWWDTSACEELWPEDDALRPLLNGIHYGKRRTPGIPENAVKAAQTTIDGPTLVRTDVPHITVYHNETENRLGISVRFDESEFETWDQVLEKLRPYAL